TNRPDALRALTLSRVLIYGHVFHALHSTQQQCMEAVCTNDSFELKKRSFNDINKADLLN
ncbi:MAG: hypothetical protein KH300_12690, partial [Sanguibacteroides justesenii]|nr:hypothetical protein [Sanguibacteroides justesenii]